MPVKVGYRGAQLMMSANRCTCGAHHNAITQDVFVGAGLMTRLPELIRQRELGDRCVLVSDENTHEAAGRRAAALLRADGFRVAECVLRRDGTLMPDEQAVGGLLMAMAMDTEFFVAVGAGTVTDIARIVATQTERPFALVPTAPSTSGYMGLAAHLVRDGRCEMRKAICPELVVCDLDVLQQAPEALFHAGIMDMVARYVDCADWSAGAGDHPHCALLAQVAVGAANKVLKNAAEIAKRSRAGTQILIESLLLCGMVVVALGGPQPVSGSERWVADAWMNMLLAACEPVPSRGLILGASALALGDSAMGKAADSIPDGDRIRGVVEPHGHIPSLPDGLIALAQRDAAGHSGYPCSLLAQMGR